MAGQSQRRDVGTSSDRVASSPLADLRFCNLLSRDDWEALPPSTRRRFTRRLSGGRTAVYVGEVVETRMSRMGWLFAQLARLIGAPLPLFADAPAPAVVSVVEDPSTGGQIWTRVYARRRGFPQVIQSAKCFAGPTGLEERVGGGIGMALAASAAEGALEFRSVHYFLRVRGLRLVLPGWMTPGTTTVTHRDHGGGRFAFTLEVRHGRFGLVLRQHAEFRDEAGHARLCEDRPGFNR
jgi:hypothetical protein